LNRRKLELGLKLSSQRGGNVDLLVQDQIFIAKNLLSKN